MSKSLIVNNDEPSRSENMKTIKLSNNTECTPLASVQYRFRQNFRGCHSSFFLSLKPLFPRKFRTRKQIPKKAGPHIPYMSANNQIPKKDCMGS